MPRESDGKPKTELRIKLYSNGFQVDDGPFRPYEAEENKQFMKELNEGYVPKEIQDKYRGKGVSVGLEDRRSEAYRPPTPPKYVAYSGSGMSMGGTTGMGLTVNKDAAGLPVVDDSQPKTTIQIRFHNGERASITLNLHHLVSDIHDYVMQAAPVDGEYQLVFGFPPKPINDPSKTIEQAGLKNAAITQRIV